MGSLKCSGHGHGAINGTNTSILKVRQPFQDRLVGPLNGVWRQDDDTDDESDFSQLVDASHSAMVGVNSCASF